MITDVGYEKPVRPVGMDARTLLGSASHRSDVQTSLWLLLNRSVEFATIRYDAINIRQDDLTIRKAFLERLFRHSNGIAITEICNNNRLVAHIEINVPGAKLVILKTISNHPRRFDGNDIQFFWMEIEATLVQHATEHGCSSELALLPEDVARDGFNLIAECTGSDELMLRSARSLASHGILVWIGSTRRPAVKTLNESKRIVAKTT